MELRTPRLFLRELAESDAAAANLYERDPAVVRYQSHAPRSLEDSLAYIRRVHTETAASSPRRLFDLAVTLDGSLIGRVGLNVTDPGSGQAALWYILHPAQWGHGYVPEAARALLDFGFAELDLHRVMVDTDPRNLASIRVAQKLGMRKEAHLIENIFLKGEWCDSLMFAILKREWNGGG